MLRVEDVKPGPQLFVLRAATDRDPAKQKELDAAFTTAKTASGQSVEVEGVWRAAKPGDKAGLPELDLRKVTAEKRKDEKNG